MGLIDQHLWLPDKGTIPHGILFAVTTRRGGFSQPPYDSLNLSFSVGDHPACVRRNRRKVFRSLGVSASRIVAAEQVHGDGVAVVNEHDAGRGSTERVHPIIGADALVTDVPRLPLTIQVADCAPVLLFDPTRQVIGLAHIGWRGAVAALLLRTVEQMSGRFECNPIDHSFADSTAKRRAFL